MSSFTTDWNAWEGTLPANVWFAPLASIFSLLASSVGLNWDGGRLLKSVSGKAGFAGFSSCGAAEPDDDQPLGM
jgi:hypothetical protein